MTIAVALKVHDGLVLAADSAAALTQIDPVAGAFSVRNVYNNANKIYNLRRGLPIGTVTWGIGSIGVASVSTLSKDLRRRFSGGDYAHPDWEINPNAYDVFEVAQRVREFMFAEHYEPAFEGVNVKPKLGFVVAGYSPGGTLPESYLVQAADGDYPEPQPLSGPDDEEPHVFWDGKPEALNRLLYGFAGNLPEVLHESLAIPVTQIESAVDANRLKLSTPLVEAAMPIQDAIDLAEFLVDVTVGYTRFTPGAPTVGGPIEIAAISKHEDFKWIRRKHYYRIDLNPSTVRGGV